MISPESHSTPVRLLLLLMLTPLFLAAFGCHQNEDSDAKSIPAWLRLRISEIEKERAPNVPVRITRATYRDQRVYYVPAAIPDDFGSLFDEHGILLGHPDGGMNGRGDGRCSDYFDSATSVTTVWTSNP